MSEESEVVSRFPPPPPFYKLYAEDKSEEGNPPPLPPKPPEDETYTMFSQAFSTVDALPSLAEQECEQLYQGSSEDRPRELKRLNRMLLDETVALLRGLVSDPQGSTERVERIEVVLKNMHHLVNSFRPSQARATLLATMEAQVARRRAFAEWMESEIARARGLFQEASAVAEHALVADAT